MKKITFLLVVLAFLAGAYLTSLDKEHVNWMYFIPILVVGFISAILFQKHSNAEAKQGHVLEGNKKILIDSLNNIIKNLSDLNGRKDKVPTYDMRFEIDKLFREDLLNFADARDSMKHLFGIQHFADIMSSFAAGERYINRVWSASVDGYDKEAATYLHKAARQFADAQSQLTKAAEGAA